MAVVYIHTTKPCQKLTIFLSWEKVNILWRWSRVTMPFSLPSISLLFSPPPHLIWFTLDQIISSSIKGLSSMRTSIIHTTTPQTHTHTLVTNLLRHKETTTTTTIIITTTTIETMRITYCDNKSTTWIDRQLWSFIVMKREHLQVKKEMMFIWVLVGRERRRAQPPESQRDKERVRKTGSVER